MFMSGLAKRSLVGAAMLWLGVVQIRSVRADSTAYVVAHNYSEPLPIFSVRST